MSNPIPALTPLRSRYPLTVITSSTVAPEVQAKAAEPVLESSAGAVVLPREFTRDELRRTLSPEIFQGLAPTHDFPQAGQERLWLALKRMADANHPYSHGFLTHFNGKPELVLQLLKQFPPSSSSEPVKDYLYVQNFQRGDSPILLTFAAGKGRAFHEKIVQAIDALVEKLPELRTDPDYLRRRTEFEESAIANIRRQREDFETEMVSDGVGRLESKRSQANPRQLNGIDEGKIFGIKFFLPPESKNSRTKKPLQEAPRALPISVLADLAKDVQDPVFVPRTGFRGTGYDLMSQREFQEKHVKPAVRKKELIPQSLTLVQLQDKIKEHHAKWHGVEVGRHEIEYQEDKKMAALMAEVASKLIDQELGSIERAFPDPRVAAYLNGVKKCILDEEHLELFFARPNDLIARKVSLKGSSKSFKLINLKAQLVARLKPNPYSLAKPAKDLPFPMVLAKDPTPERVFGTIVQEPIGKEEKPAVDQHNQILQGLLQEANHGRFVVNLLDAASSGSLYGIIKTVKDRQIQVESPWNPFSATNHPEPVPFHGKVLILDPEGFYDILAYFDPKLAEHFDKIPYDPYPHAEEKPMQAFAANLIAEAKAEKLLPIELSGLASLMEHLLRKADSKSHFAAHHTESMKILHDASALAAQKGERRITGQHVEEAIQNQRLIHNLRETRLQEWVRQQILKIETRGERVGESNGLAVYGYFADASPLPVGLASVAQALHGKEWLQLNQAKLLELTQSYQRELIPGHSLSFSPWRANSFGLPTCNAAAVSNTVLGSSLRPNDAKFIGPSMEKGYKNVESYLREKLGEDNYPLFFEIMMSMEQNHSPADGDSGGASKFLSALSRVSGIPVDKSIFITGALGIHGDVQPIGGANEKVEGAYKTCVNQGLTGKQGVALPASNMDELMLDKEIVDACRPGGKFHVWPLSHIDELIELAMHVKSTVAYDKARQKLTEYREKRMQLIE